MEDILNKVTVKEDKILHTILDRIPAESKRTVPYGFDDCISGKVLPGYTEPSMAVDAISRS